MRLVPSCSYTVRLKRSHKQINQFIALANNLWVDFTDHVIPAYVGIQAPPTMIVGIWLPAKEYIRSDPIWRQTQPDAAGTGLLGELPR
jgi:hypothetical protein